VILHHHRCGLKSGDFGGLVRRNRSIIEIRGDFQRSKFKHFPPTKHCYNVKPILEEVCNEESEKICSQSRSVYHYRSREVLRGVAVDHLRLPGSKRANKGEASNFEVRDLSGDRASQ
jgi:hypothetical protein